MGQHQKQVYLSGFSLLELLLVLLIAAILTLLGLAQYKHLKQSEDRAILKTNVALLLHSINHYYLANCQNKPLADCNANRDSLKSNHLWPTKLHSTNFVITTADDNQYDVGVESIAKPESDFCGLDHVRNKFFPCRLYVTVKLKASGVVPLNKLNWYRKVLGANSVSSLATLKWITKPTYTNKKIDTHLWILKSGLEKFKKFQNEISE